MYFCAALDGGSLRKESHSLFVQRVEMKIAIRDYLFRYSHPGTFFFVPREYYGRKTRSSDLAEA